MSRFSAADYAFTSDAGVKWYVREDDDGFHYGAEADATPVIEANKSAQNSGRNGYTADKTYRLAARIPPIVEVKWMQDYNLSERGIDIYSEEFRPTLFRLLNSNEYRYLRAHEFNL